MKGILGSMINEQAEKLSKQLSIVNVKFEDKITQVIWSDGTISTCENDTVPYDREKSMLIAIVNKFIDKGSYDKIKELFL